MRLKHNDRALVAKRFDGVEERFQLARMVGVIVVDVRAVVLSLELKPTVRAGESGEAVADSRRAASETDCRRGSRERVFDIVNAGNAEAYMREHLFTVYNVKLRFRAVPHNIGGVNIRALVQSECEDIAAERRKSVHGVFILGVRNDVSVFRYERGKFAERRLHILKVLEEVEMVGFNVQDDRHGGRECMEGIVILARLHHDCVARADAVTGVQQRQRSADHNGRVTLRGHEDVRAHGGRCRFAVRTGDAERVPVVLHNRAPRLRALKYRKAAAVRLDDFRVFVMHGGGADNKLGVRRDILRAVSDKHGDAERAQMRHVCSLVHIRTGDDKSRFRKNLRQRRHGYAANADQMAAAPRPVIFRKRWHGHTLLTKFKLPKRDYTISV